jgi:transposase-like protein
MQSLTAKQLDVLQALSSGQSVTAAADSAGVHRTTVYHWTRTIPEFRHTLEAVKQARIDRIRDQLDQLAAPSLAILSNIIHDDSAPMALRARTAMTILKFLCTPQKANTPRDSAAELLMDAAYAAGHKRGMEWAAEDRIHHNSSLSSISQSDEQQIPRNALCPCGSKLKYKRCCGRNAPPVLGKAA